MFFPVVPLRHSGALCVRRVVAVRISLVAISFVDAQGQPLISERHIVLGVNKGEYMSKTWEHYENAARHHERAAHHYEQAAKYDQAEENEEALHHAYLAHEHSQNAILYETEIANLHASRSGSSATPTLEVPIRGEVQLEQPGAAILPIAS
jgi:hypothetical protein